VTDIAVSPAKAQTGQSDKDWLARTSQAAGFRSLAASLPGGTVSAGLRKRLIRAKKFWCLVERFGQEVLSLAPTVCVTRLDPVPQGPDAGLSW
jgi:hypothetical protein